MVNHTAFTAQLIQFKVMKTFNHRKCSWGMLFSCLSTQINLHHVLKMPAVGTYACFESWIPLVNGCTLCIVQCCVKRLSS